MGSDPDNVAACPDNTVSPSGSVDVSSCVPKIGYYGQPGQPANICPAVRPLWGVAQKGR
jgi:hypothetical protein